MTNTYRKEELVNKRNSSTLRDWNGNGNYKAA